MYIAFEYIDTNGTRRVDISDTLPAHRYCTVLKKGSLQECQSHLYPNGDADEDTSTSTIPFSPKY